MQKKLEMKIPHTWSELAVSHNFCNLFMKCPIFETRQNRILKIKALFNIGFCWVTNISQESKPIENVTTSHTFQNKRNLKGFLILRQARSKNKQIPYQNKHVNVLHFFLFYLQLIALLILPSATKMESKWLVGMLTPIMTWVATNCQWFLLQD